MAFFKSDQKEVISQTKTVQIYVFALFRVNVEKGIQHLIYLFHRMQFKLVVAVIQKCLCIIFQYSWIAFCLKM